LGSFGMVWAICGCSMFPYCSHGPDRVQLPGLAVIKAPFRSGIYASTEPNAAPRPRFNRNSSGATFDRTDTRSSPSPNPWPVLCKHQLCDCDQLLNAYGAAGRDSNPRGPAWEPHNISGQRSRGHH
jgi:hypothetical protein